MVQASASEQIKRHGKANMFYINDAIASTRYMPREKKSFIISKGGKKGNRLIMHIKFRNFPLFRIEWCSVDYTLKRTHSITLYMIMRNFYISFENCVFLLNSNLIVRSDGSQAFPTGYCWSNNLSKNSTIFCYICELYYNMNAMLLIYAFVLGAFVSMFTLVLVLVSATTFFDSNPSFIVLSLSARWLKLDGEL